MSQIGFFLICASTLENMGSPGNNWKFLNNSAAGAARQTRISQSNFGSALPTEIKNRKAYSPLMSMCGSGIFVKGYMRAVTSAAGGASPLLPPLPPILDRKTMPREQELGTLSPNQVGIFPTALLALLYFLPSRFPPPLPTTSVPSCLGVGGAPELLLPSSRWAVQAQPGTAEVVASRFPFSEPAPRLAENNRGDCKRKRNPPAAIVPQF